jgi:hypothetical protein
MWTLPVRPAPTRCGPTVVILFHCGYAQEVVVTLRAALVTFSIYV